jgi:hypothetical protein
MRSQKLEVDDDVLRLLLAGKLLRQMRCSDDGALVLVLTRGHGSADARTQS